VARGFYVLLISISTSANSITSAPKGDSKGVLWLMQAGELSEKIRQVFLLNAYAFRDFLIY
jgi:hypothetical protein